MKLNHEDSGLCLTEWKHALGFMTLNHDDSGLCLTGWKHALETCFVAFFFFLKKKRKKKLHYSSLRFMYLDHGFVI